MWIIMRMVLHLFILLPIWKNIKAGGLLDCAALSAGKDPFWQQNISPDRIFITQSKHIIL